MRQFDRRLLMSKLTLDYYYQVAIVVTSLLSEYFALVPLALRAYLCSVGRAMTLKIPPQNL